MLLCLGLGSSKCSPNISRHCSLLLSDSARLVVPDLPSRKPDRGIADPQLASAGGQGNRSPQRSDTDEFFLRACATFRRSLPRHLGTLWDRPSGPAKLNSDCQPLPPPLGRVRLDARDNPC